MNQKDASQDQNRPSGGAAGRLSQSILGCLHTRIELFLLELEEEKGRWVEMLTLLVCLAVFALVFLGIITLATLFFLPDHLRGAGLVGLGLVFGLMAFFCFIRLRSMLHRATPSFSESMDQLKKDQACFSDHK
jgi:uncharacterized membrane protein YqjE